MRLIATNTISAPVARVDFTDLEEYSELLVIGVGLTLSVSGFRTIRLSTDNGATFYSTSGDYQDIATTGVATANAYVASHGTSASAARDIAINILNNIPGAPKICINNQAGYSRFAASTNVVDAIRVLGTAGNLTAGTIYILGR
jgi:hypothetical protein